MAICLELSSLDKNYRKKIKQDLSVKKKKDQFDDNPPRIKVYDVDDGAVYIPMGQYRNYIDSFPEDDYPKTDIKFTYDLFTTSTDSSGRGRDQDVVAKEIEQRLKNDHTAFASCHTGYGKCLAKGTDVLIYGGGKKKVEEIVVGDRLIGDDGTERLITGTCNGRDTMYEIITSSGRSYTVNSCHILTLSTSLGVISDIPLELYLSLSERLKSYLYSVSSSVEYSHKNLDLEPYLIGRWIGSGHTRYIPDEYLYSHSSQRLQLAAGIVDASCEAHDTFYLILSNAIELSSQIRDLFCSLGITTTISEIKNSGLYRIIISGSIEKVPFRKYLAPISSIHSRLERFSVIKKERGEYYGFEITGNGRFVLGNYILTHNTTLGTYFISKLKLKTVLICDRVALRTQWRDEIKKFTGDSAAVQIVKKKPGSKLTLDRSADVYIMGVQQTASISREDVEDIGFVIVDEAHMSTVTTFTVSLLRFQPRYLLGLSATPDRKDGLHSILELYFGPMKNFIVREEKKTFTIHKYETKYTPEIDYRSIKGEVRIDWNKIMTSIAENTDRHRDIAQIAIDHPDRKIIILCNRVVCVMGIFAILDKRGCSVDWLCGKKCSWDESSRILVAGVSKAGTGLNNTELNMLILEADMKDVRQCEGRIRTVNNIVYDIVDDYNTFENHWKKRRAWYRKRGATIVEKTLIDKDEPKLPRFLF